MDITNSCQVLIYATLSPKQGPGMAGGVRLRIWLLPPSAILWVERGRKRRESCDSPGASGVNDNARAELDTRVRLAYGFLQIPKLKSKISFWRERKKRRAEICPPWRLRNILRSLHVFSGAPAAASERNHPAAVRGHQSAIFPE